MFCKQNMEQQDILKQFCVVPDHLISYPQQSIKFIYNNYQEYTSLKTYIMDRKINLNEYFYILDTILNILIKINQLNICVYCQDFYQQIIVLKFKKISYLTLLNFSNLINETNEIIVKQQIKDNGITSFCQFMLMLSQQIKQIDQDKNYFCIKKYIELILSQKADSYIEIQSRLKFLEESCKNIQQSNIILMGVVQNSKQFLQLLSSQQMLDQTLVNIEYDIQQNKQYQELISDTKQQFTQNQNAITLQVINSSYEYATIIQSLLQREYQNNQYILLRYQDFQGYFLDLIQNIENHYEKFNDLETIKGFLKLSPDNLKAAKYFCEYFPELKQLLNIQKIKPNSFFDCLSGGKYLLLFTRLVVKSELKIIIYADYCKNMSDLDVNVLLSMTYFCDDFFTPQTIIQIYDIKQDDDKYQKQKKMLEKYIEKHEQFKKYQFKNENQIFYEKLKNLYKTEQNIINKLNNCGNIHCIYEQIKFLIKMSQIVIQQKELKSIIVQLIPQSEISVPIIQKMEQIYKYQDILIQSQNFQNIFCRDLNQIQLKQLSDISNQILLFGISCCFTITYDMILKSLKIQQTLIDQSLQELQQFDLIYRYNDKIFIKYNQIPDIKQFLIQNHQLYSKSLISALIKYISHILKSNNKDVLYSQMYRIFYLLVQLNQKDKSQYQLFQRIQSVTYLQEQLYIMSQSDRIINSLSDSLEISQPEQDYQLTGKFYDNETPTEFRQAEQVKDSINRLNIISIMLDLFSQDKNIFRTEQQSVVSYLQLQSSKLCQFITKQLESNQELRIMFQNDKLEDLLIKFKLINFQSNIYTVDKNTLVDITKYSINNQKAYQLAQILIFYRMFQQAERIMFWYLKIDCKELTKLIKAPQKLNWNSIKNNMLQNLESNRVSNLLIIACILNKDQILLKLLQNIFPQNIYFQFKYSGIQMQQSKKEIILRSVQDYINGSQEQGFVDIEQQFILVQLLLKISDFIKTEELQDQMVKLICVQVLNKIQTSKTLTELKVASICFQLVLLLDFLASEKIDEESYQNQVNQICEIIEVSIRKSDFIFQSQILALLLSITKYFQLDFLKFKKDKILCQFKNRHALKILQENTMINDIIKETVLYLCQLYGKYIIPEKIQIQSEYLRNKFRNIEKYRQKQLLLSEYQIPTKYEYINIQYIKQKQQNISISQDVFIDYYYL